MVGVVSLIPSGASLFLLILKPLNVNFVQKCQKCQICVISEKLELGVMVITLADGSPIN